MRQIEKYLRETRSQFRTMGWAPPDLERQSRSRSYYPQVVMFRIQCRAVDVLDARCDRDLLGQLKTVELLDSNLIIQAFFKSVAALPTGCVNYPNPAVTAATDFACSTIPQLLDAQSSGAIERSSQFVRSHAL